MRSYLATTVTIGSGRSIHWGSDCGTMCGAAHRNGFFTEPKPVKAETATCKRCIKIMVIQVNEAYAIALEAHQEILDAEAVKSAGVEVGQVWTSQDEDEEDAEVTAVVVGRLGALVHYTIKTGERAGTSCSLSLAWFTQFWTPKAEAAVTAYPEAVKLDTWLTEGVVLVGPATDSLYVFEQWQGGTAVVRHVDTNALERVAQADITTWKYLPGLGSEEIDAAEVKMDDVIRFHAEGSYRTVSAVLHHEGTELYSFSIHGALTEFVRHATDKVARKKLPKSR